MVSGFDQGAAGLRDARAKIARATREELLRAGLPVAEAANPTGPGAEIEVDFGDDEAGGVFVTWHANAGLMEAAAQSVLEGRPDDPAIQQSGAISQAMRDSMIAILRAAQYVVAPSDDDMRPLALRVVSAPCNIPDA